MKFAIALHGVPSQKKDPLREVLVSFLSEPGTDLYQPNRPPATSGSKMTQNLSDMASNVYGDYPGSLLKSIMTACKFLTHVQSN